MKKNDIADLTLSEEAKKSPLYSEDLGPVPVEKRSWKMWDLAAIWVGMAVCIPTYLLASYMIKSGLNWVEAMLIIALGNIIVTIPMVLNGHAGVKYGIPFPVVGRASFGTKGIHIASIVRGIVACGWFGIQTWVGGLAFYEIWNALMGTHASTSLEFGKFVGFFLFWLVNVYFIWKGTDSIKQLEKFAAPILIGIGLVLIGWGAYTAGGFSIVLKQSEQLSAPAAMFNAKSEAEQTSIRLNPVKDKEGVTKASHFRLVTASDQEEDWLAMDIDLENVAIAGHLEEGLKVQFQAEPDGQEVRSAVIPVAANQVPATSFWGKLSSYLLWLTAMVGFWATMAISIADITRYSSSQKEQLYGQFIGLPGTMILFSFVGVFVTCAAVINFSDVLAPEDAPWDPVSLLGKFDHPVVVIVAQIFMIIATLSTNIAANVIAPANAFSNIAPKQINFQRGGLITAIIGIIICPWWLMDEISGLLLFVSSFLGPVLAILVADYFVIRKKNLQLEELFKIDGIYSFSNGFNPAAMIALAVGVAIALAGLLIPSLSILYTLSWFTGFGASFLIYWLLMRGNA